MRDLIRRGGIRFPGTVAYPWGVRLHGRVTQISAIRAALDKVALGLLEDHVHHCVMGADAKGKAEMTDELMAAVARFMRRG
jgi:hypothetical protein